MAEGLDDAAQFYGVAPVDEAEQPELPAEVAELWRAFLRLSGRRARGMDLHPISYEAIAVYQRLYRYEFSPWEIEMIEELDGAWMLAAIERRKASDAGR